MHADDAIGDGVEYSWAGPYSKPYRQRPITCLRCGKPRLFWKRVDERWRLHHYATVDGCTGYVLHVCGGTSEGMPSEDYPPSSGA